MTLTTLTAATGTRLAQWRHRLFHSHQDAMMERAPGEIYLRCLKCGLRSTGITTGPLRATQTYAGDKERFVLRRPGLKIVRTGDETWRRR